jgi:hypothetical protein
MIANHNIDIGEEIASERPLGTIKIQPTFSSARFFNPNGLSNGMDAITNMVNHMSPANQALFNALHRRTISPLPHMINFSIMATNCFSSLHSEDGQEVVTLVVHNHISRANNSCRPNAIYAYDHVQNLGTLRALQAIPNGQEITIEYLASVDDSLQVGVNRRRELHRNYGFWCSCPACRNPMNLGQPNQADDTIRTRAGGRYQVISNTPLPPGGLTHTAGTMWKTRANGYVRDLSDMEIADFKLAGAFIHRAEVHKALYQNAVQSAVPAAHCNKCAVAPHGWHHLNEARNDYAKAETRDRICYGPNHPQCEEVLASKEEVEMELANLGSPRNA